jgi:uncharacterized protein
MSVFRIGVLPLLALAAATNAEAASFDCKQAARADEKAICADAKLSTLDEFMGRYFEGALLALRDGAPCLRADQRVWLAERRRCGGDRACLEAVHLHRLGALHGLQPGVTALRHIALPQVPALIAAIPPESGTPPEKNPQALQARGPLLWEQADINHMGLAVRGETGRVHVIVFDADIGNSDSHRLLQDEIKNKSAARFLITGVAGARGNFAPGHCRMVYRLR